MKRLLNKLQLPDWIALGLLLLYVTAFSWMTIRQHNGFRTNALDLGKFDQMIWNAAQGRRPYSTITQQSAVQGHFSQLLAQHDSWPADAHRPTSVLPPGTVVRDVHYLTVPQAISGEVVARVGLYDEQGTHLTTQEGQEFVDLSLGG
ncbi:MAG: DUF2079 domain-containing protein [Chloroflexota bacterium]|nr:DUF2079 domain-containing protein [Chloroflexota bacterium]